MKNELLKPTKIYSEEILNLTKKCIKTMYLFIEKVQTRNADNN